MQPEVFQEFISQVASRLRHDLKGGLITLKMGLESLPKEEALKPLLLEKAQELVELSDKLVLLLRMGRVNRRPVRLRGLFEHAASRARELYPPLKVETSGGGEEEGWTLDPDAVTYAVLELCQNAGLAGATQVDIALEQSGDRLRASFRDDGRGLGSEEPQALLGVGISRWDRSGLGLAIAERCAVGHGGRLWLSDHSSGTVAQMEFRMEDSA